MRKYLNLFVLFFVFIAQSCKTSLADYTIMWSGDIKQKIIEDANMQFDSIQYDSVAHNVTLYKEGKKLKFFHLKPKTDSMGLFLPPDTVLSIFYGIDQRFELIKELCPGVEGSFEVIRYNRQHVGLVELRFCDGKIKERGFRFGDNVGLWKEFDTNGNMIKETDYKNMEKLEQLKSINYFRE